MQNIVTQILNKEISFCRKIDNLGLKPKAYIDSISFEKKFLIRYIIVSESVFYTFSGSQHPEQIKQNLVVSKLQTIKNLTN
jgi:hypothetical protein